MKNKRSSLAQRRQPLHQANNSNALHNSANVINSADSPVSLEVNIFLKHNCFKFMIGL